MPFYNRSHELHFLENKYEERGAQSIPIYGKRRVGKTELIREFFKDKPHIYFLADKLQDNIQIHDITQKLGFWENLNRFILTKGEMLYEEVDFILREELNEPRSYFSILRAIALGKRKLAEITNETGLSQNVLTKYLAVLRNLRIVEKEVPVIQQERFYPGNDELAKEKQVMLFHGDVLISS